MTQASDICAAIVTALLTLSLQPALVAKRTCYVIASPAYIPGQQQRVIQVSPGAVAPDGVGKGSQEGGALERIMTVRITVFIRLKLDQMGRSEIVMIEATDSLHGTINKIIDLFKYTYLGGVVTEPLWYEGEGETEVIDADSGVYAREIRYGAKWGVAGLQNVITYS